MLGRGGCTERERESVREKDIHLISHSFALDSRLYSQLIYTALVISIKLCGTNALCSLWAKMRDTMGFSRQLVVLDFDGKK